MKLKINMPEWAIVYSMTKVMIAIMVIVALAGFITKFIVYVALPLTGCVLLYLGPRVYRALKVHDRSWRLAYQDLRAQWSTGTPMILLEEKKKEK